MGEASRRERRERREQEPRRRELLIRVTGLDALNQSVGNPQAAASATAALEASLRRQTQVLATNARLSAQIGQGMADGLRAVDARLAAIQAVLNRTATATGLGFQRAAETAERGFATMASRTSLGLQRAAEAAEKAFQRTAKSSGDAMEASARRAGAAWDRVIARATSGAGGGLARLGTAGGQVLGSIGGNIGGLIAGLGSGGIGGLFRTAGGLGATALQGGVNLAGVGVQGVAGAAGSSLGLLGTGLGAFSGPAGALIGGGVGNLAGGAVRGLGGLASGALQAGGAIAGGAVQLAGNVGGEIVDSVLTTVKVGLAAGIGVAIAAAVRATEDEPIRNAFTKLAESTGSAFPEALGKLREATRGTVSDLELMKDANTALQLGAVANIDEFGKLSAAAVQLGRAVGRGPKEAIADLTFGLGRQSVKILDNLGIIVKAEKAYADYARSLGKTAGELTATEERFAFQQAALKAIDEKVASVSTKAETFGEKWDRATASMANLLTAAGRPMLDILGQVVDKLQPVIDRTEKWLSEHNVEIAANISKALEGVVGWLGKASSYLTENSLETILADAKKAGESLWVTLKDGAKDAFQQAIKEAEPLIQAVRNIAAEARSLREIISDPLGSAGFSTPTDSIIRIAKNDRVERGVRKEDTRSLNPRQSVAALDTAIQGLQSQSEGAPGLIADKLGRLIQTLQDQRSSILGISKPGSTPKGTKDDPIVTVDASAGSSGTPIRTGDSGLSMQHAPGPDFAAAAKEEVDRWFGRATAATGPASGPQFPAPARESLQSPIEQLLSAQRPKGGGDLAQGTLAEIEANFAKALASSERFSDATQAAEESFLMAKRLLEKETKNREEMNRLLEPASEKLAEAEARLEANSLDAKEASEQHRDNIREMERLSKELPKVQDRINETQKQFAQKLEDATARINEQFAQAIKNLEKQFRAQLPGVENDPALPANVRRGFRRGDQLLNREIKDDARREFGSFSAGEIARNPDLRADIEARMLAIRKRREAPLSDARDRAASRVFPEVESKAIGELTAEKDAKLAETASKIKEAEERAVATLKEHGEAIKAAMEATTKALDENVKVMATLADAAKASKVEVDNLKETVKNIKKTVEDLWRSQSKSGGGN